MMHGLTNFNFTPSVFWEETDTCLKHFVALGVGTAENRASSLLSTSALYVDIPSEMCSAAIA